MSKTPKISVLMPIYNTNPVYLREVIESILNQTYTNFEFIILNNSPANTALDKIVAGYSDKRIRYLKADRELGIADGHNFLLDQAKAEYIALTDHDDISLPDRLKKQLAFLENHPEIGLCGTGCHRFGKLFKTGDITYPLTDDDIRASLLFKCPILHPSTMMRRSLLVKHKIRWDNRFISLNDRKLYLDLTEYTKLGNIPDILYLYRLSPQMTSKTKQKQIQNEQGLFREICLKKLKLNLTSDEVDTLNNYVFKGRCRIKDKSVLPKIALILDKLVIANTHTHFAPDKPFQKICAKYLIKRCRNAAFYGHIGSASILSQTKLPVKVPLVLRIFNSIFKS